MIIDAGLLWRHRSSTILDLILLRRNLTHLMVLIVNVMLFQGRRVHDLLLVLMLHIVWINHNMLAHIPIMMTNDLRMRMVWVCTTVIH